MESVIGWSRKKWTPLQITMLFEGFFVAFQAAFVTSLVWPSQNGWAEPVSIAGVFVAMFFFAVGVWGAKADNYWLYTGISALVAIVVTATWQQSNLDQVEVWIAAIHLVAIVLFVVSAYSLTESMELRSLWARSTWLALAGNEGSLWLYLAFPSQRWLLAVMTLFTVWVGISFGFVLKEAQSN